MCILFLQENASDAVSGGAPAWVTQWAALTNKSKTSEPPSPSSSVSDKGTVESLSLSPGFQVIFYLCFVNFKVVIRTMGVMFIKKHILVHSR